MNAHHLKARSYARPSRVMAPSWHQNRRSKVSPNRAGSATKPAAIRRNGKANVRPRPEMIREQIIRRGRALDKQIDRMMVKSEAIAEERLGRFGLRGLVAATLLEFHMEHLPACDLEVLAIQAERMSAIRERLDARRTKQVLAHRGRRPVTAKGAS
jgi:hypothetical protein